MQTSLPHQRVHLPLNLPHGAYSPPGQRDRLRVWAAVPHQRLHVPFQLPHQRLLPLKPSLPHLRLQRSLVFQKYCRMISCHQVMETV